MHKTLAGIEQEPSLYAAIDKREFPPCIGTCDCSSCWTKKWCAHKMTPLNIRIFLCNVFHNLNSPIIKLHKDDAYRIRGADKTDIHEIGVILAIAQRYCRGLRGLERLCDDQS